MEKFYERNFDSKFYEHERGKKEFFNSAMDFLLCNYPFEGNERRSAESKLKKIEKDIAGISDKELAERIKKVFNDLENTHTYINERGKEYKYIAQKKTKIVEGKYWIEDGGEWYEIIKLAGIAIDEFINEEIKEVPGGTAAHKKQMALNRLMASKKLNNKELEIEQNSINKKINVEYKRPEPDNPEDYVNSEIIDGVGVIVINSWSGKLSFNGKNIDDLVEKEMEKLKFCHSFVVDVRNNSGGDSKSAIKFSGRFLKTRNMFSRAKWRESDTEKLVETDDMVDPEPPYLDNPVIILTGPKCLSSNELFIMSLKDTGRAITIGEPTGGGSGNAEKKEINLENTSYNFSVSTTKRIRKNGRPLNNIGIEPDVEAHQTTEDLKNNKDTVLEKALEYYRVNKRVL